MNGNDRLRYLVVLIKFAVINVTPQKRQLKAEYDI